MSKVLVSFMLASCFFLPPVFPAAPGGAENAAPVALSLEEAVRLALNRAPEILLAEAQARRAREAVREARALNLPQVSLGSGLAYNNGFPLSIEGSAPSLFQVGLSQAVLSKKNGNLIREAEKNSVSIQIGVETARNELAATTALAYGDLYHARRLEVLWSDRLESARQEEETRVKQREAGRVRSLEVTLARTETAEAAQQLLVAREQARLAETQLRELSGLPDTRPIQPAEPRFAADVLNLPGEQLLPLALRSNPGIRQAEADVEAREKRVEAERGERYPKLSVVSEYALFSRDNNYQDYFNTFTRNNFLVGVSIQVPVFTGFRTSARVAQSLAEVDEARFSLQRQKSALRLGLEKCASALRIARGAVELARQQAASAMEGLDVQKTLLEAGRVQPEDVESAWALVKTREIGRIEAEKTLYQQQVELLRLSGTLGSLFPAD